MGFVIGFLLIFFSYPIYRIFDKRFSLLFWYLLWWGSISFLAELKLRGESSGSSLTYMLILSGALFYLIGYAYASKHGFFISKENSISSPANRKMDEDELNKKLIYSLGIFSVIFLFNIFQRVLQLYLNNYPIGIIRQMYWSIGDGIINNPSEYFIAHTVVDMVTLLYTCIFAIQFCDRKLDKFFLFLFALIFLLNASITGGRMALMDIITTSFFVLLIKRVRISFRLKRNLFFLTFLLAGVIIYLTFQRQGSDNIIAIIWSQYTVNIPFMSYLIDGVVKPTDISYGYTFFRGFFDFIFVMLSRFGITSPDVQNVMGQFTNPFFIIPKNISVNAYTSHLFYFYIDGRFIGILFGSSIFGFISGRIEKNYYNFSNNANLIRLLIMFNVIYYTFYQWKFVNSSYLIALLVASWCFKKNKQVIKKYRQTF